MNFHFVLKHIFFLAFFMLCVRISSQDISLRQLTTDDGLPENTGQTIIQDKEGFIWIGTQNGLARYDGFNFKVFKHNPADTTSLSNNQVEDLLQDKQGYIWVATRNGLNRFDPKTQYFSKFFPDTSGKADRNWFTDIIPSQNGQMLASTFYGVYQIKSWQNKTYNFYNFNPQEKRHISALHVDGKHNIWVNVSDSLFVLKNEKLQFKARLPSNVNCIIDSNDKLLMASASGVFTWDKISGDINYPFRELTSNIFCVKVYKDKSGQFWVLTSNGVYVYDDQELVYHFRNDIDISESLSHNLALDILEDKEGLFWMGTGQGVNIFNPHQNQFLRLSNQSKGPVKILERQIEAIHFSDPLNVWLAGPESIAKVVLEEQVAISSLRVQDWPVESTEIFSAKNYSLLADDNIDYIVDDDSGGIYIGMKSGNLLHLDNANALHKLNALTNYKQLRSIYRQPHTSILWCGAGDGLYVYDIKKDISYIPNWLPDIDVVQFGVFQDELWVGTPNGVYVVDPVAKTWRSYTPASTKNSLTNTMLTHTFATDSVLWFSTFGGGLIKYSPEKDRFKAYGVREGLSNNNVWSVYPDQNGLLWSSTDQGVAAFDPKTEEFTNYTTWDGLNFNDFSMTAHGQSSTGELWFGNPEGLTIFQPENLTSVAFRPHTGITKVELNYESDPQAMAKILEEKKLILQPTDKTITFSLAALSFQNPKTNRLAFKLEGYDSDWVYQSADHQKITYTNLPHGHYTFHAKSSTKDGNWGEELAVDIQVIPPFYKTIWFKLIVIFTLIISIGLLVYLYSRRKYRKQIETYKTRQRIQDERERISKDLHDHVGAHLTRIITDLDLLSLQLDKHSVEDNKDRIESTRGFTRNTIQLLRDTIWAIHKDSYSVEEFAGKCKAFLKQYLCDIIKWEVTFEVEQERKLTPNQVLNLLRVLQEATQNMLKHADATSFKVRILSKDTLNIEISDDGKGMEELMGRNGHYGLQNMNKRVQDIGGDFKIRTVKHQGVNISITL